MRRSSSQALPVQTPHYGAHSLEEIPGQRSFAFKLEDPTRHQRHFTATERRALLVGFYSSRTMQRCMAAALMVLPAAYF